ncbi:chemotaxis protein CheA [Methylophaga sp.]|uniref:chemotaxis protein CheA n=1 Tax=Methylophaga sp. TaxID=2024840 RepID=UPI003F698F2C
MFEAAMSTFFEEASENLDLMEQYLLSLEKHTDSDPGEELNALFRAVHTIKGSAGLFGFDKIVSFTHGLENMLQELRSQALRPEPEQSSLLFSSRDHIANQLAFYIAGNVPDDSCDAESSRLSQQIQHICDGLMAGPVSQWDSETRAVKNGSSNPYWHLSLRFDKNSFKDGMDPLPFIGYLAKLGRLIEVRVLEKNFPEPEMFDPENCYLALEVVLEADVTYETVIDTFEFVSSDRAVVVIEPGSPIDKYQQLLEIRRQDADEIKQLLADSGALTTDMLLMLDKKGDDAVEHAGTVTANTISPEAQENSKSASLRVDSDKLDTLINLIGELVTTGAGVALIAQANPDMSESVSNLNGLVEEIRDAALKLRMVPVAGTFKRFNRVVRDTSKALGKEATLIMSGEDTELDKSVIEHIADPLMHLVRNAIDHGIEMPAERLAKGKPPEGVLRLSAYHESGSIVLEISDDGKGLDPAFITDRALERGLISDDQNLTKEEAFQLIFEPGFSTKDEVTDLSGRGVGMDVVRRNITELRGRIEVDSESDRGTTFRIFMPLTLAIIDGFLIAVAEDRFVLPLDSVEECVALSPSELKQGKKGAYMMLRNEVLPILDLRQMFELVGRASRRQSVIVVNAGSQRFGLIVDRLLGEFQTVIKPMGNLFKKLAGISGSTIMADGQLALILDVDGLTAHFV